MICLLISFLCVSALQSCRLLVVVAQWFMLITHTREVVFSRTLKVQGFDRLTDRLSNCYSEYIDLLWITLFRITIILEEERFVKFDWEVRVVKMLPEDSHGCCSFYRILFLKGLMFSCLVSVILPWLLAWLKKGDEFEKRSAHKKLKCLNSVGSFVEYLNLICRVPCCHRGKQLPNTLEVVYWL